MIQTEQQYHTLLERIEELLQNPDNIENQHAKGHIERKELSDLVADYEEQYFPVKNPLLADVIKLRMAALGLNQKELSALLGVSTSRVSEPLNAKITRAYILPQAVHSDHCPVGVTLDL